MTDTNSLAVIEIKNLVASYGALEILHGIDLDIQQGEIMVIMGGSGSGKSTFLRHIIGLNRPVAGTIRLLGLDITAATAIEMFELRKKIGMSFQGGALFTSMNILENIKMPLKEHTRLDDQTMDIMARMKLEMVSLGGFDKLMPAQLSGGMIKRAALARAIIMDPKLLFFDEPSAGLDPVVSAELDETILKIRKAMRTTIVVVTHELESAFRIADRITVLDDGNILMTGTVDEIKQCDNERIQNLLNRQVRDVRIDADEYLQRLTGKTI